MDISLNLIDETIAENLYESNAYKEFCLNLDELGSMFNNDMIVEAVGHQKMGMYQDASRVYHNTKETTKSAVNMYKHTTDAGGSLLSAVWKVIESAFKLIVKVTTFICTHIDKIPILISKLIDAIADLPSNVKNKIKGNIKLYITAEDIVSLYSIQTGENVKGKDDISLFARLDTIINDLTELTQGDLWVTYFTNKKSPMDFFRQIGKDFIDKDTKHKTDIALIKKITKQYNYIQNITFDKTLIDMNNPATVEIYFGTSNKLKYKDHRGNDYECTYLEALRELLQYIIDKKSLIKTLQKDLNAKLVESQDNSEFAKMGTHARNTVTEFFKTVSKLVELLGNMTRYITADINTVEKSCNIIKANATRYTKGDTKKLSDDEKSKIKSDAKKYFNKHPLRRSMDKVNKKLNNAEDKVNAHFLDKSKKEMKDHDKVLLREFKRKYKNKIDKLEKEGWKFYVEDEELYGIDPDTKETFKMDFE